LSNSVDPDADYPQGYSIPGCSNCLLQTGDVVSE